MKKPEYDDMALIGGALAWATVLALIGSGVMALRAASIVAVPVGWLAVWGPVAAVIGVCSASLRLLDHQSKAGVALGVTAIVLLAPLSLFGELLKRVTHHRPLGAVTFALLSAVVLVLAIAVTYRLVLAAGRGERRATIARSALIAGVALGFLFSAGLLVAGLFDDSTGALWSGVLDLALFAVAVAFAFRLPPGWGARRPLLSIGFWLAAIVVSGVVLALVPAARAALAQAVPSLLPVAGWLGG